jgi:hypothetical protein
VVYTIETSNVDNLILETIFIDHANSAIEDSWLGKLWKWVSSANLTLKLKGREATVIRCCAGSGCDCEGIIAYGTGARAGSCERGVLRLE